MSYIYFFTFGLAKAFNHMPRRTVARKPELIKRDE